LTLYLEFSNCFRHWLNGALYCTLHTSSCLLYAAQKWYSPSYLLLAFRLFCVSLSAYKLFMIRVWHCYTFHICASVKSRSCAQNSRTLSGGSETMCVSKAKVQRSGWAWAAVCAHNGWNICQPENCMQRW